MYHLDHLHDHIDWQAKPRARTGPRQFKSFRKRFYWSLFLTVPIILLSFYWQEYFVLKRVSGLLLILATSVFFYGGWLFFRGAIEEIKNRIVGLKTFISLVLTYLYLSAAAFSFKPETTFWLLAVLTVFSLLAFWLGYRAVGEEEENV